MTRNGRWWSKQWELIRNSFVPDHHLGSDDVTWNQGSRKSLTCVHNDVWGCAEILLYRNTRTLFSKSDGLQSILTTSEWVINFLGKISRVAIIYHIALALCLLICFWQGHPFLWCLSKSLCKLAVPNDFAAKQRNIMYFTLCISQNTLEIKWSSC